ncbi:MAG: alpha/beta fold hydrolase [Pseudomonadota bacterium]
MRRLPLAALLCWLSACLVTAVPAEDTRNGECVILLHGLGRTALSMRTIEAALTDAGYCVRNRSYPSRSADIEWLAAAAIGDGLAYCEWHDASRIHFVTHSLGGILVRQYLQDNRIENLGRIVMLSPPNQGSEIAELLKARPLYRYAAGPAGAQLGTGNDSVPLHLAPIPGQIGIITGASSLDPWFSPLIPGADDGKVSVERARLAEMHDFLVVDHGHTFIMQAGEVIAQIIAFLQTGSFRHEPAGGASATGS